MCLSEIQQVPSILLLLVVINDDVISLCVCVCVCVCVAIFTCVRYLGYSVWEVNNWRIMCIYMFLCAHV